MYIYIQISYKFKEIRKFNKKIKFLERTILLSKKSANLIFCLTLLKSSGQNRPNFLESRKIQGQALSGSPIFY